MVAIYTRKPSISTASCAQTLPEDSWFLRSRDTALKAHRRDQLQSETIRPTNKRNNQMVKGKHKNPTNRNHGYLATSEGSSLTTASPRDADIPEKQELDLKAYFVMLIEDFQKDINNSLKEILENMGQQVEALNEETQKSLKATTGRSP